MKKLHKIAIVSGKGGVGKTTITVNLGLALYNLGANIILLDGNITTPNLGLYMGILKTPASLNDVLSDRTHISETIFTHSSGLNIVSSDLAVDAMNDIDFRKIKNVLPDLGNHADLLLVDTAATLGSETQRVLGAVDEIILVTNQDKGALADALKTIGTAKRIGTPIIGVIVNNVKKKLNYSRIEDFLGIPIIGTIKHDEKFLKSTEKGKIYLETYKTNNVDRFYEIAERFLGNSYTTRLKKEKDSLFQYMLRQIGLLPR